MEFTLVFLPFMAMLLVVMDTAWAVFAKTTLQYAVRVGVRTGITLTGAQVTAAGQTALTPMVKNIVKQNSSGLLANTSLIHVHYLKPPATGATNVTDVSTASGGNKPGNIMLVSIDGYSLQPLVVRVFTWKDLSKLPTTINVSSADLIEPSRDTPPIGTAP